MLLMLLQAAAALKAVELHAFTKSRGGGNPASVALVADWPADDDARAGAAARALRVEVAARARGLVGPGDVEGRGPVRVPRVEGDPQGRQRRREGRGERVAARPPRRVLRSVFF